MDVIVSPIGAFRATVLTRVFDDHIENELSYAFYCRVNRMMQFSSRQFAIGGQILDTSRVILLIVVGGLFATDAVAETRVDAYAGSPLGVGRVVVDLPTDVAEVAQVDDRFTIGDADSRVLYPAAERARVRKILRSLLGVQLPRKLTYYFMFKGDAPLELDIYVPDRVQITVSPRNNQNEYDRLLNQWWQQYVNLYQRVHQQAEYPIGVQTYLTAMWAGRLGEQMPKLEGFLVREKQTGGTATGKLLADEAYRASILRDLLLGDLDDPVADLPLPQTGIPVAAASMPTAEVAVEPIATHVPEECFYVRFGTFQHYLWFREFLGRWQGDLGNMLVLRSIRRSTSDKLCATLGLRESNMSQILGPQVIDDIAIVGMDPFFRDGTAVGVLFQAKNNFLLSTSLSQQRSAAAREVPGARSETVDIAGHSVSLVSSPDGAMRSYYATDGNYHLVTSSKRMVERFYEAGSGDRPLAAAADFLSARQTYPITRDDRVFVHLSQAFLTQLTGPAYRIELDRRLRSIETNNALMLARLAAEQEGLASDTEADLVAGSFLPEGFSTRADGATWQTDNEGRSYESIRGYPGQMVPIADRLATTCSASEHRRYEQFVAEVTQEVGQLVPLSVSVHRDELATNLERIAIDVHLQRYSATNLAAWIKKLGPPSSLRVAPIAGDVVSANVVLGGLLGGGEPFHVFAGVRDGSLPLVIRGGGLQLLGSVQEAVEGYVGAWPKPQFLERILGGPQGPYDNDGFARTGGLLDLWIRRADDFLLFSFKRNVLFEVGSQLAMIDADRPAQAWLAIRDLAGSQYESAVTAFAYARSRSTSASGSRFMNSLVEQLHVDKHDAEQVANQLVAGEFVCPLGGEYLLVEVPGGVQAWASTAAAPNNQFLLTEIPANYRFPLLDWFRGMTAELMRGDDWLTLSAVVDVSVERPAVDAQLPTPPQN